MYYILYTSSEDNYMYYDYNKTIEPTNKLNTIQEQEEKDSTCIICWANDGVGNDNEPILLKQNKYFITFCDCNTHVHHDCLLRWYCRTFSCPICRTYLIYDPHFINKVRLRRKVVAIVSYGYNIVKQITNIVWVFVVWNIGVNILYTIYLACYSIEVNK